MIKSQDVGIKIKEGKPLGFPSFDELIEYSESGEDKKNALEYEKAYIALIEQVKDKSHEEQVKFLMSHMDELRGMLDLFSFCRDDELFPESLLKEDPNANDEILANLMIYRYENDISILDDQYCEQSKVALPDIKEVVYERRAQERRDALDKLKKEHPEQYQAMLEKDRHFFEDLAEELAKDRPYTQEEIERSLMSDDDSVL